MLIIGLKGVATKRGVGHGVGNGLSYGLLVVNFIYYNLPFNLLKSSS